MLNNAKTYVRYVVILVGIVFTAEFAVMKLFDMLHIHGMVGENVEALSDAATMMLLSAVPVYLFIIKPIISTAQAYQDRLENLVEALEGAADAVLITDTDRNIIYVNKAFTSITGYTPDEVIGQNPKILQSGKQSAAFYKMLWHSLNDTGAWQGEIWNKRKNGEIYPEHMHIRAIRKADGTVKFYVAVFSDITEQQNQEKALRQSQKMEALGTMVGGVAHNFNNMLAGIMGKSYLARKKSNEPVIVQYLQDIEDISHEAAGMIKQLLTFSRANIQQQKKNTAIVPLIEAAVQTARLGISKQIECMTDFTDEPLMIYCDPAEIQQAIINVINNAGHAVETARDRKISVFAETKPWEGCPRHDSCSVCDAYVVQVVITDTGCGISELDLEHVFDPFFTTKEVGKGTGLGLSMAKGIVESHGGVINMSSVVDVGSRVEICLPITNMPIARKNTGVAGVGEQVASLGDGETILVIDADEVARTTLEQIFCSLGYLVLLAVDDDDGIIILLENVDRVSLLVTAGTTPEHIVKLRNIKPELPIVFVARHGDETVTTDVQDDLLARWVPKPFNVADLSRAVHVLLHPEPFTPDL